MVSTPKSCLVYLDQNFLSDMAKADINEKVRPEFKEIYELLHQGFVDEKLVVPASLLHDIESSLAYASERPDCPPISTIWGRCVFIVRTKSKPPKPPPPSTDFLGRTPEDPLRPESRLSGRPRSARRTFRR